MLYSNISWARARQRAPHRSSEQLAGHNYQGKK